MSGFKVQLAVVLVLAGLYMNLPVRAQSGVKAETFKASAYLVQFDLRLPDGQEVKGLEPEGSMIRVTTPQGEIYGLTPIIEDGAIRQVRFHVFSIIQGPGGNEAMKELQPKTPGVRFPGFTVLQVTVVPRPVQSPKTSPLANTCVQARCCVTCNGWTACACAVTMGCDSCCCNPCCGIL